MYKCKGEKFISEKEFYKAAELEITELCKEIVEEAKTPSQLLDGAQISEFVAIVLIT